MEVSYPYYMPPKIESDLNEWKNFALSHVLEGAVALLVFFVSQINSKLGEIGEFNKLMDKRVVAIEISRQEKLATYERLLTDFEVVKMRLTENTVILNQLQHRR